MTKCDHKVVIVLDHSSRFAIPSNSDIQVSLKGANGQTMQVALAKKTLWSWSVEALLEYHRIVSDLFFDTDRLFRVTVADSVGKMLQTSWDNTVMSYSTLTSSLAPIGAPNVGGDDRIPLAGIVLAVEALSEKTPQQEEKIRARKKNPDTVSNDGSIVVFCSLKSQQELNELEKSVQDMIQHRNANIGTIATNLYLPVDMVNLYVINTYPRDGKSAVATSFQKKLSSFLNSTVVSSPAGEPLISAIHSACLSIHDLVSTTVSGIPMKEEANQGISVNYDVELLHPRTSHAILEKLKLCGENGFLEDKSRNLPYSTYKLAWSTPSPKNKWNLFPKTLAAVRVSPAAVNSRPSVCLTSFVLSGRNVMLEVKRSGPAEQLKPNVNQKLISHTLISHNGRIYIHAIDILPSSSKQPLDEQLIKWPTITTNDYDTDDDDDEEFEPNFTTSTKIIDESEDVPEKILADGTLRMDDMCRLIEECMLKPREDTDNIPNEEIPCGLPLRRLRQLTRYWPTRLEDSLIFQCTGKFNDIIEIFRKPDITSADIETGKKAIYRLLASKTTKEPLFKGNIKCNIIEDQKNREEHYRVAFIELASYLGNYVNQSENHAELFRQLMDILDLDQLITINTNDVPMGYDDGPALDSYVVEKTTYVPPTKQSSRSASPVPKKMKKNSAYNMNESINIYELLCSLAPKTRARPDFVGRVEAGKEPAKLYKGIDFSNAPPRGQEAPM